jgi:GTP-binding protein
MSAVVAIVGKPNVGKSTLFNRIVGRRIAVTSPIPGVTRDRNYATSDWNGTHFILVDTGGFVPYSDEPMLKGVKRQVELAILEADVIVFVIAHGSVGGMDYEIAESLRKANKSIVLAVNKVDDRKRELSSSEFHSLGFADLIPISALHGRGTGDLLDEVVARLPVSSEPETEERLKLAVIGRPNVGKSSLINRLLGEERVLVDAAPGTTRDSIDTEIEYDGRKITLIDTAGLRRKARIKQSLEYYTVLRSIRSVERCDVAIIMLDAEEGAARQDKRIVALPLDFGKGIVIVVNKMDLAADREAALERVEDDLDFLDYYPLVPTSCTRGEGIFDVLKLAARVSDIRMRRIEDSELKSFLNKLLEHYPPPPRGKRRLMVHKIVQVRVSPPTFILKVNKEELLSENYRRYIRNSLKKEFEFVGTPVRLRITEKRIKAMR